MTFPGDGTTVVVSSSVKGKIVVLGTGDLTFKGKHDPEKTWYRVVIHNSVSSVVCRITCRDAGGRVMGDDDVILDEQGPHDNADPAGDASKLSLYTEGAVAGFVAIQTLVATAPLVPLGRPKLLGSGVTRLAADSTHAVFQSSENPELIVLSSIADQNESAGIFVTAQLCPPGVNALALAVEAQLISTKTTSATAFEQNWSAFEPRAVESFSCAPAYSISDSPFTKLTEGHETDFTTLWLGHSPTKCSLLSSSTGCLRSSRWL